MWWTMATISSSRDFIRDLDLPVWSPEDQLYQLKLHLDKTAMDVFCMLSDTELNIIEGATSALGKQFKPKNIEELCGLEFHHKGQGDEIVDQLGITIQQLGRKAFPQLSARILTTY